MLPNLLQRHQIARQCEINRHQAGRYTFRENDLELKCMSKYPGNPTTQHSLPAFRRLVTIASPLYIELSLGIGAGLIGTTLAAHISDPAAAAYALSNHIAAMLFILFRIIGAGISVVITQNLGSGRREVADRISRAVLAAATWVGLACVLVALLLATPLMHMMNAPANVLPLAVPFLMWLAPAILLDAWIASMSSITRAHFHARDALVVAVIAHAMSLSLAIPLMFGAMGLPAMGLPGFALASIGGRLIALWLCLRIWRTRLGLVPVARDWWQLKPRELGTVMKIGVPAAAENIAYRFSFMVSVAVAGLLGTNALATQAYALQISYIALMFGLALGFAVEIVVGHMIGAGHLHDAHRLVRRALAWGLGLSVTATGISALVAPWTLRMFTDDAAIIASGTMLLWLTVLLEPGRTFNLVIINGLRAAGDVRYPVIAGAASMLVVLAGGSWLLGVYAGYGLTGLWIAYAADEWIRGLLMWRRWVKLGWVPHARDARRRMRHSSQ